MSDPVIIDAGPALSFFATNNEKILFAVLPHLHAPEVVQREVLGKAKQSRFARAEKVWKTLLAAGTPRLSILSDTPTTLLSEASQRVTRGSLDRIQATSKDQGETMVVIHADALAFQGKQVTVIIDDGGGKRLASTTIERLSRARRANPGLGQVRLIDTPWILAVAAKRGVIADRATMKKVYDQLRPLDDGLLPIEQTNLLDRALYETARPSSS